jgi:hypothetical protein
MSAAERTAPTETKAHGVFGRWWRARRSNQRKIDFAVWDLRERYGDAAYSIACSSAKQPVGYEKRRFWRKVAEKLRQLP